MGRHDKPHQRIEIRCDGGIADRMEKYLEKFNSLYEPKLTKTKLIENAIEEYLTKYKYMIE